MNAIGTIYLFSTLNYSTVYKCFKNTGKYSSREVKFSTCCKDRNSIFNFVLTDCNNYRYEFTTSIFDFMNSLHTVESCINKVSYITIKSIFS